MALLPVGNGGGPSKARREGTLELRLTVVRSREGKKGLGTQEPRILRATALEGSSEDIKCILWSVPYNGEAGAPGR